MVVTKMNGKRVYLNPDIVRHVYETETRDGNPVTKIIIRESISYKINSNDYSMSYPHGEISYLVKENFDHVVNQIETARNLRLRITPSNSASNVNPKTNKNDRSIGTSGDIRDSKISDINSVHNNPNAGSDTDLAVAVGVGILVAGAAGSDNNIDNHNADDCAAAEIGNEGNLNDNNGDFNDHGNDSNNDFGGIGDSGGCGIGDSGGGGMGDY